MYTTSNDSVIGIQYVKDPVHSLSSSVVSLYHYYSMNTFKDNSNQQSDNNNSTNSSINSETRVSYNSDRSNNIPKEVL